MRFAAGLGKLDDLKRFVQSDGSLTADAGRLADPYVNRFRCARTRENILCQALCFAAQHARLETVEFLLARGADTGARDHAGQTPYERALMAGRADLAKRLRPSTVAAARTEEARC